MKKSNVIIFVVVILVIIAIFGYAIWDANNSTNGNGADHNTENFNVNEQGAGIQANAVLNDANNDTNIVGQNETFTNTVNTNTVTGQTQDEYMHDYFGTWYIDEASYLREERIDNLMDRREDGLITEQEFQAQLSAEDNSNIAELEIDRARPAARGTAIEIDFTLTSPAPTQREASIKDIIVQLDNNTGTFTYTDNWGTSGNGTITFANNQVTLRLETTQAGQGALWGVEGIYTFSYRRMD